MRRPLVIAYLSAALLLLLFFASRSHRAAVALRGAALPDPHAWVLKPEIARLLTLGENELWADLAWIRTVVYYGNGLVQNTGMPDVEKLIGKGFPSALQWPISTISSGSTTPTDT